jgi:hypothetical protein
MSASRAVKRTLFLDSFCGALAELPRGRRTVNDGLQALAHDPRVSTFERGAPWLERLIRELVADGLAVETEAEPYPWHRFKLTDAGRQMLARQQVVNVRATRELRQLRTHE